jgi:hypothetical protein
MQRSAAGVKPARDARSAKSAWRAPDSVCHRSYRDLKTAAAINLHLSRSGREVELELTLPQYCWICVLAHALFPHDAVSADSQHQQAIN